MLLFNLQPLNDFRHQERTLENIAGAVCDPVLQPQPTWIEGCTARLDPPYLVVGHRRFLMETW